MANLEEAIRLYGEDKLLTIASSSGVQRLVWLVICWNQHPLLRRGIIRLRAHDLLNPTRRIKLIHIKAILGRDLPKAKLYTARHDLQHRRHEIHYLVEGIPRGHLS